MLFCLFQVMNKVSDGNRNIRKQRGDDVCERKQRTHICWSLKVDTFVSPGPTVRPTHPLLIRSGEKVFLKCRTLTSQLSEIYMFIEGRRTFCSSFTRPDSPRSGPSQTFLAWIPSFWQCWSSLSSPCSYSSRLTRR